MADHHVLTHWSWSVPAIGASLALVLAASMTVSLFGRVPAQGGAAAPTAAQLGTMRAPALAGSPRVPGHRDYVIKVLLGDLVGPLDGRTYAHVMVPTGGTDEWIAGVASYVRNSFGHSASMVAPADVARVRAEMAGRSTRGPRPSSRRRSRACSIRGSGRSRRVTGPRLLPVRQRSAAGRPACRRRLACG